MANWGKLLTRGLVEDRRNNVLPVQYTRPIVNQAVPLLGTPNRYGGHFVPTPGDEIAGLIVDNELSRQLPPAPMPRFPRRGPVR